MQKKRGNPSQHGNATPTSNAAQVVAPRLIAAVNPGTSVTTSPSNPVLSRETGTFITRCGLTAPPNQLESPANEARVLPIPQGPLESQIAQSQTSPLRVRVYHIQLCSMLLEYTDADFVDPPVLSNLISTPAAMFGIWDDESPYWGRTSPLIVRSQPIAVKHWKTFYTNFKGRSKVWTGIKQNWSSWKVVILIHFVASTNSPQLLMNEYGSMSKEDFTAKWSIDGEVQAATRIITNLRTHHAVQDRNHARLAKEEYPGESFTANFSYHSGGKVLVIKDEHAIAKRYLKLKCKQGIS